MTKKTTLRERFANYDFANCEEGATIENNWRLVKNEPISTKHNECATEDDGRVILIENDRQMSNFAPREEGGRTYKMPDGTAFVCTYKLTPVSTDADGNNTGFKAYYCGTMIRGGAKVEAFCLDSTSIKNRLFGKQAWASQKGPRVGAIPTTSREAREYADAWTEELVNHIEAVEKILATYGGATMLPDFTMAKRICKFRARKHSETLLEEYRAQQETEAKKVRAKTTAKKADKLGEVSAADMLAILAAKGITLEQLMAAQAK